MTERCAEEWLDLLSTFELSRPEISGSTVFNWPREFRDSIIARDLLCELPEVTSLACTECFESPFCEIVFTESHNRIPRALLACPHCGLTEIPVAELRRWRLDREVLIQLLRQSLNSRGRCDEMIAGKMWRLGRWKLDSSSWPVWFGMHLRHNDLPQVLPQLCSQKKALLLVPSRIPQWTFPEQVVVGTLSELTAWNIDGLQWDEDLLQELVSPEVFGKTKSAKPAPLRRQTRAADIEALAGELEAHLRAARDYAYHTRDYQENPRLLPRPTQKELAARLEITESRVSRSINDTDAKHLRLLWNLAEDLDGIMRYGR